MAFATTKYRSMWIMMVFPVAFFIASCGKDPSFSVIEETTVPPESEANSSIDALTAEESEISGEGLDAIAKKRPSPLETGTKPSVDDFDIDDDSDGETLAEETTKPFSEDASLGSAGSPDLIVNLDTDEEISNQTDQITVSNQDKSTEAIQDTSMPANTDDVIASDEKVKITDDSDASEEMVETPTEILDPVTPGNPVPDTVDPGETACIKGPAKSILLEVSKHYDRARFEKNPKYDAPAADVMETSVVKLDLDLIEGNHLPVTEFALDDVPIIVKPEVQISDVLSQVEDEDGKLISRTITVPDEGILLHDGNNQKFAQGAVDSDKDTTYIFENNTLFLPGKKSMTLKQVYGLGAPLIAHDKVSISKMQALGFVNENNELEFKIMHVAHGHGDIKIKFEISSCIE